MALYETCPDTRPSKLIGRGSSAARRRVSKSIWDVAGVMSAQQGLHIRDGRTLVA